METLKFALDHTNPELFAELPCPRCQHPLTIHLPDPDLPDRLLGTCSECKSWFLLDGGTGNLAALAALGET